MSKGLSLQERLKVIKSNIFSSTQGKLEADADPAIAALTYSQAEFQQGISSDIDDSINQVFARTATDESFLAAIAFDKTNNFIQRKAAKFATGEILVVSEIPVDISVGSQFITSDGNVYESTIFRTTFSQSFIITNLQRISGIAYATIPDHNLGNLMTLAIAGANETAFNGSVEITIVDKDTIRYNNSGTNQTATGTISGSFFGNRVSVKSVLANSSTNKSYSSSVDIGFTSDLTAAYITYNGINGGADIEDSLTSFKPRIIEYLQYPQNAGNLYQHISWTKQNSEANYCYFFNSEDSLYLYLTGVVSKMDDNYDFTNFSSNELINLKANFIDNNQLPLSGVSALTFSFVNISQVPINITINGLTPSSNSMKAIIQKRLKQYIALLPIKFYLKTAQLSSNKIESVISGARDEAGNTPSISSVSVSGTLTTNTQKPVLGSILYA